MIAKLKSSDQTVGLFKNVDNTFASFVVIISIINFLIYDIPNVAMWLGFALASLSAIGNDSLQTLGTFIASNRHLPKWILILFFGAILILTIVYG